MTFAFIIAPTSYGVMVRETDQIRLNTFAAVPSIGFTTQFTTTDFDYTLSIPCPHTTPTSPTTPTQSPTESPSSSSNSVNGGSIFLIILFLSLFVYIIGGLIWNYKSVTCSVRWHHQHCYASFAHFIGTPG